MKIKFIFLSIFIHSLLNTAYAQISQDVFGHNRIQHTNFKWEYISTDNFDIYFYYGGRESAIYAAKYAELEYSKLTELVSFYPYKKIKLLSYNTPYDLLQSNITAQLPNPAVGGQTNLIKSKVEVAFTGSHVTFRKEIKKEITRYLISEMIFGGSVKEVLQNSYMINLPDWYINGLATYAGYGWSSEMDDFIRETFANKKLKNPNLLSSTQAEIVGQSLWNFIAKNYGKSAIGNIVNATKVTKNEQTAIENVLGISYKNFIKEWRNFYKPSTDSIKSNSQEDLLKFRGHKGRVLNELSMSNTGEYVVFTENYHGKYKVWLYDLKRKKKVKLLKGGMKVVDQRPDLTRPLVSIGSDKIGIIELKKKKCFLKTYTSKGKFDKKIPLVGYERILDFDYSDDGNALIISAQINGQSDLHYYNFKENTYKQLTSDFNDDLQPRFLKNSYDIVFSSNRKTDTLIYEAVYPDRIKIKDFNDNFDLFIFKNVKLNKKFIRITDSYSNETQPIAYDKNSILFLSDINGINNIYKFDIKLGKIHVLTNAEYSIKNFDFLQGSKSLVYNSIYKSKDNLFYLPEFDFKPLPLSKLPLNNRQNELISRLAIELDIDPNLIDDDLEIDSIKISKNLKYKDEENDIDNYVFESEKKISPVEDVRIKRKRYFQSIPLIIAEEQIKFSPPTKYKHILGLNNIVTSVVMDNLRGFGTYMEIGLADMLGNHKITGGVLGFINLRSSNMFLEYQCLKYRWDFKFRYDKNRLFILENSQLGVIVHKYTIDKFEFAASYPFTNTTSFSISPFYLNNKFWFMWPPTASFPIDLDKNRNFSGVKLQLMSDNTVNFGLNMMKGFRAKIVYEYFNSHTKNEHNFNSLIVDIRKYLPLHKEIVLATRASAGTFWGKGQKMFMMGGVDNMLNRDLNKQGENNPQTLVPFDGNSDLLFNRFVTNMRSFRLNELYGSSYFLLNAELRIPIVRYLYHQPIGWLFFRNLQLTPFFDFGSAWTGNLLNQENTRNTTIYNELNSYSKPFSATVVNYVNPYLYGYGVGLRSYLMGYYLKFDLAWGQKDYKSLGPQYYFSLGHDF